MVQDNMNQEYFERLDGLINEMYA